MTRPTEINDDDMMRRYLDGELTRPERALFLEKLIPSQRAELSAMEKALEALANLPVLSPPADMTTHIMTAIMPEKLSLFLRIKAWLLRHSVTGLEIGSMAVAAAVLFLLLSPGKFLSPVPAAPHPYIEAQAVASMAAGNAKVGFSLYAPGAKSVSLISDFNGWSSERSVQLHPLGNDKWGVTVKLRPGSYQYAFLINGHKVVTDPVARHVNDDFGHKNAIVTVI
ncbi:MAG TPA: hypothetical protein VFN66_09595 [Burkholderiales bacterium]|nr:hypothetical protein [Burkholderiales bacterium]